MRLCPDCGRGSADMADDTGDTPGWKRDDMLVTSPDSSCICVPRHRHL